MSEFSCAKISSGKTFNTTASIYAYSCSYTQASDLLKAMPFAPSKKMLVLLGSFLDSFFWNKPLITWAESLPLKNHAQDTVYMLV